MTAKSMGYLLMSALLMGGLLVPGHAPVLTVNQPAPDFTLPSTMGDPIRLSQFRGKKMVLLEFYGMNFAITCTKNLTVRMVDFEAFKDLDIEILGISVDEAFAQQTFAESLGLPFPLLSDTEATVTHLYGAAKLIPGGTGLMSGLNVVGVLAGGHWPIAAGARTCWDSCMPCGAAPTPRSCSPQAPGVCGALSSSWAFPGGRHSP